MSSGMSTGQIVGAAGGAAIGFFVGGPTGALYGAQIGMTAGGLIDPPAGASIEGPRLKDLSVMVSTYGNAIPLVYGNENRVAGNVIWSTGLIERAKKKKSGGKGGGGGSSTAEYSYSVSFAMAIGAGPLLAVRRIWANSKLIYDVADGKPIAVARSMTFYPGSTTQMPNPLMEQHLGAGNVPAYRGTSYIVFDQLQLADFGNRMPNIEVEVQGVQVPTVAGALHDMCRRAGVENASVAGLQQPLRGYVLSSGGTAAASIAPMASAFYFDVAEQAGQVRFVKRGQAMKGTIRMQDMGATDPSETPGVPVTFETVTALEMPKEVTFKYADPAMDYQINAQRAQRERGLAQNNMIQESAITMTADEARRVADRLLWEHWTARRTAKYRVDDKWLRTQPGDVLGIPVDGQIIPHKLLRATRGHNGIIDIEAQRDDPEIYQSNATGAVGELMQNVVRYPGVTRLVLIDGPIVRDQDDDTGFYWAASSESDGWRGAEILRSSDGGASFSEMSPVLVRSDIGDVQGTLPGGPADLWDRDTVLTVVMLHDSDELESLDEDSVLRGNNAAWVGNPNGQGGEIIQFATATLVAPRTYELRNLLRGRLGTEARIGTHGAGEVFVLVNAAVNGRSDYGPEDWQRSRLYKPVSILTEPDDTAAQSFTNTGVGKIPLSPVHITGTRDGENNLTAAWVRRTRLRVPGLGSGPVPLGEETESYEVDILVGSTVVRTLTSTAPVVQYTAAQQSADGITPGSAVSLRVYQMSTVRGRGFPGAATV